jgi:hypothetical protein
MAASSSSCLSVLLASWLVCAACLFVSGDASGAAHRVVDPEWHPATATWYGSAEGDGSDGNVPPWLALHSILTSFVLSRRECVVYMMTLSL